MHDSSSHFQQGTKKSNAQLKREGCILIALYVVTNKKNTNTFIFFRLYLSIWATPLFSSNDWLTWSLKVALSRFILKFFIIIFPNSKQKKVRLSSPVFFSLILFYFSRCFSTSSFCVSCSSTKPILCCFLILWENYYFSRLFSCFVVISCVAWNFGFVFQLLFVMDFLCLTLRLLLVFDCSSKTHSRGTFPEKFLFFFPEVFLCRRLRRSLVQRSCFDFSDFVLSECVCFVVVVVVLLFLSLLLFVVCTWLYVPVHHLRRHHQEIIRTCFHFDMDFFVWSCCRFVV